MNTTLDVVAGILGDPGADSQGERQLDETGEIGTSWSLVQAKAYTTGGNSPRILLTD